jgi:hypothetical protein
MQPQLPEQLNRISVVLRTVVAPAITDPYARDVLSGLAYTIATLGSVADDIPGFLAWDAHEAADVLATVGTAAPPPPAEPLDLTGLEDHHRGVRTALQDAMPLIVGDPTAQRRMARYAHDRLAHNPYNQTLPSRPVR